MIRIERDLAVIVCAGPSLDRLTPRAWRDLEGAGAIVAINGALAAEACANVRFTHASAMDVSLGLMQHVPRFRELWEATGAWRLASVNDTGDVIRIREVDERDGVDGWADDDDAGYAGGSSAMVTVNWLCNGRAEAPPYVRGFRRVAFLGLDMIPGEGGHARGAGTHTSGFALGAERHQRVSRGWENVCREASRRGVDIVNLTPGTGLRTMPRSEVPPAWQ